MPAPTATPVLFRVCAWCLALLGSSPCEPALAGKTSHGICATCAAAIEASIETLPVPVAA